MARSPARSPGAEESWCILLHCASSSLEAGSKTKRTSEKNQSIARCLLERKQDGENDRVAEGSGPLQRRIGGDLGGSSHPVCWLMLSAAEGLQPPSPTPVYADKMQSMRLSPGIVWQESFAWAGSPPARLTG